MYIRVINNNTDVENLYNTYIKINSSILKKYPLKKFSFIDLDNKTYDKDDSFIKLIKMKFKDQINKHTLLELLTHYFLLKDIEKDESIHLNDYILILNDNFEMGSNFNNKKNYNYPSVNNIYDITFLHSISNDVLVGNAGNIGESNTFSFLYKTNDLNNLTEIKYPGSETTTTYGIWYNTYNNKYTI